MKRRYLKIQLNCFNPCLIHAVDDTYIIAYSTADNSGYSIGYIVTLKIWKNGSIGPIEPRKAFEIRKDNKQGVLIL